MLRINKASEYGVLALGFIGSQPNALSAREVSDSLGLPYEITAKTLQRLKEAGFIVSTMGTRGGYKLKNQLSEISVAQVIDAVEGPIAFTECSGHGTNDCSRTGACGLQSGMQKINERIRGVLESVKLDELAPKSQSLVASSAASPTVGPTARLIIRKEENSTS